LQVETKLQTLTRNETHQERQQEESRNKIISLERELQELKHRYSDL